MKGLFAFAAGVNVAQVADYIADANCKETYIRHSKPACVANGKCSPVGSADCQEIDMWQWDNHAPGVNPAPRMRVTANGDDKQKTVWTYAGDITQGEAMQVYSKSKVTAEGLLNTPVNMVSFIANVLIDHPKEWFHPGKNNTDGCGQEQTWELPFGFEGNSTTALPKFQKNLQLLHENGVTVTMTMGSWCTSFPVLQSEEWSEQDFGDFVDYFKTVRETTFGGYLDGIDFDWEGYCSLECLKGANTCHCAWSDDVCGDKTPEELAAGVHWTMQGDTYECWRMATKSTIQVMTGITYHMKQAGFVVTLVPMSTQVYSGEDDTSANKVLRNEMVQHRMQPYPGGKPIDGNNQVNLLDLADSVLLQWYSGFDAALCKNVDDPKACSCDNVPDEDYPNVINTSTDGMISFYWNANKTAGNMFPTSYPVRCQSCSGTEGPNKCASEEETWFRPCGNSTDCVEEHKAKLANYSEHHNHTENWWVQGVEIDSKCPRAVDCPDWQYEGEPRYSRQMNLLKSLAKVVDLEKVSIGFEALGVDVQVQMQAYVDPAMPWTAVTPDQLQKEHIYYTECVQNLTATNEKDQKRCAQPLLTSQWGLKFNATDMVGLDAEVQKAFGKSLNGVGFFTLDGVIATPKDQPERYWRKALLDLNSTWAHIPARGVPMPTPAPKKGACTKTAPTNACGDCSSESDCGNSDSGRSYCWASKDPTCKPAGAGFCVHSATKNACGSCSTETDCGNDSTTSMCWAAKDWQCPAEVSVVV